MELSYVYREEKRDFQFNVDTERFNQVESAIENNSRNWFPSATVWMTDCDRNVLRFEPVPLLFKPCSIKTFHVIKNLFTVVSNYYG